MDVNVQTNSINSSSPSQISLFCANVHDKLLKNNLEWYVFNDFILNLCHVIYNLSN